MSTLRHFSIAMIVCLGGCMAHERVALHPETVEPSQSIHGDCRGKVYVVLLHGFDPMDWSALAPLRDALNEAGFARTYYGHWYHAGDFAEDIIRRRETEPDARIIIVCGGLGIDPAHELAARLNRSGIEVAALYGIDTPFWASIAYPKPANVERLRYVNRSGALSLGTSDDVELTFIDSSTWNALAKQPDTVAMILNEVTEQAGHVTHQPSRIGRVAFCDPAPSPRRTTYVRRNTNDAWDFLRPTQKLESVGNGISTDWTVAKPKSD